MPRMDWNIPAPRKGWFGRWDNFAGPGYTPVENLVVFGSTLFLALLLIVYAAYGDYAWSWWKYLLAFLLAFDIVGGAVTMAAAPGKRWYHRPGQTNKDHWKFIAIHLHPFLVGWVFLPEGGWTYGAVGYVVLLAGAWLIMRVPLYLKRPMATAMVCAGCFLGAVLLPEPTGFGWFLPVFYVKLFLSHLVREEPYRSE